MTISNYTAAITFQRVSPPVGCFFGQIEKINRPSSGVFTLPRFDSFRVSFNFHYPPVSVGPGSSAYGNVVPGVRASCGKHFERRLGYRIKDFMTTHTAEIAPTFALITCPASSLLTNSLHSIATARTFTK